MKPTRYYVTYFDTAAVKAEQVRIGCDDVDPGNVTETRDFETLKEARRFFRVKLSLREAPQLYERTNIRDVTPDGVRGLLWDWDRELRAD